MTIEKLGLACQKLQHSGGMERYILDLINGFNSQQIKLTCFAKSFDTSLPEYKKVVPIPLKTNWVPGKLCDHLFSRLLKYARQKEDVGPILSVARTAYTDVAICGGTHLGFLKYTNKKKRISDQWQIRLEHQFYERAKLVIAHSKMMADELMHLYHLPAKKIEILYPPVDKNLFYPSDTKESLKNSLNMPLDKKVFLFPSSSHRRKGYDLLEKYFSTSDLPIHLAVVGRPLPRPARNIAYYGYHLDITPFYQAADFTIIASTYEPFGLVAVESLLCGTPIIASNRLGAVEILSEEERLIFEAGNLQDLDRIIRTSLSRQFPLLKTPEKVLTYNCTTLYHCQEILRLLSSL